MTTVLVAFAVKNGGTGEIAEATFGGRLDRATVRALLPWLMASGSL